MEDWVNIEAEWNYMINIYDVLLIVNKHTILIIHAVAAIILLVTLEIHIVCDVPRCASALICGCQYIMIWILFLHNTPTEKWLSDCITIAKLCRSSARDRNLDRLLRHARQYCELGDM